MNNLSKSAIIWLIISIALSSAFMIFAQENPKIINSSLFTQLVIVTVGSILGLVGALIGYAIRQFAKPRTYVSSDGVIKIIKTKVFLGHNATTYRMHSWYDCRYITSAHEMALALINNTAEALRRIAYQGFIP